MADHTASETDTLHQSRCPFSRLFPNKQHTYSIGRLPTKPSRITRILTFPWRFVKQLRNTYLLLRHQELRAPIAKNVRPSRWLNTFSSLFVTFKVTTDPELMKTILQSSRKDPEGGVFSDHENARVFFPLLRDLYPDEDISEDDFLLTCNKAYVATYRRPLLRFIGPHNINQHGPELEKVVTATLAIWGETKHLDLSSACLEFTSHVISRLVIGHPGPSAVYQEISHALEFLSRHTMKRIWHQRTTSAENQQYAQALEVVRNAIATGFNSPDKPALGSLVDTLRGEYNMTDLQIKSTLFLVYLGGAETTASLLNFILWQLGQKPHYQDKIYQELSLLPVDLPLYERAQKLETVDQLFAESIRLHTPVYAIGRQLFDNLEINARDADGKQIDHCIVRKKEGLLCAPHLAARNPDLFAQPDFFEPERHEPFVKQLPWLPFGSGKHACPGQWLAKAEIITLITALVGAYRLTSTPKGNLPQKGYMTLKIDTETQLALTKRS